MKVFWRERVLTGAGSAGNMRATFAE